MNNNKKKMTVRQKKKQSNWQHIDCYIVTIKNILKLFTFLNIIFVIIISHRVS